MLVDILEGIGELLFHIVLMVSHVRHPDSPVLGEIEFGILVLDIEVTLPCRRDETVSDGIVKGAELDGVILESQGQPVVFIVNDGLLVGNGRNLFSDLSGLDALDLALAVDESVVKVHRYFGGSQDGLAVEGDRICYLSGSRYLRLYPAVRRGEGPGLLCSQGNQGHA